MWESSFLWLLIEANYLFIINYDILPYWKTVKDMNKSSCPCTNMTFGEWSTMVASLRHWHEKEGGRSSSAVKSVPCYSAGIWESSSGDFQTGIISVSSALPGVLIYHPGTGSRYRSLGKKLLTWRVKLGIDFASWFCGILDSLLRNSELFHCPIIWKICQAIKSMCFNLVLVKFNMELVGNF